MLKMLMAGLAAFALLSGTAMAQVPAAETAGSPMSSAPAVVPGLELPPDQTVTADEGFVTVQAKTKGEVNWLVLCVTGNVKVKYVAVPASNSIIVSIPPVPKTVISVFAVALVDGKMTPFVRTNITVGPGGNVTPPPVDPPFPPVNPPPLPLAKTLHVTFVVDLNSTTPALAQVLNSPTLRKAITDRGNYFRLYDMTSPVVVQKKLDAAVKRAGGSAVMIIQKEDGTVLTAIPAPSSEAAVIAEISKLQGGN